MLFSTISSSFKMCNILLGDYRLRVQNEAGTKEFTYKVIVYSLPNFKNSSNNEAIAKAIEGTQFKEDCDVDAIPLPEVCVIH